MEQGRWCKVFVRGRDPQEGFFYTQDPVSGSVVLYQPDEQKAVVLLGHAVETCQADPTRTIDPGALPAWWHAAPVLDLDARRAALHVFLEKHRVPASTTPLSASDASDPHNAPRHASIQVLEAAQINPPYVMTSVTSDQPILRQRVQDLIHQFDTEQDTHLENE